MTIKVTLSKGQAAALEARVKQVGKREAIRFHMEFGQERVMYAAARYQELKEIDVFDFIEAIYTGYEVKPAFYVGEWVTRINGEWTFRIGSITCSGDEKSPGEFYATSEDRSLFEYFRSLRPATAEEIARDQERRKWAKLNRQPGEFEAQDVIQLMGGKIVKIRTGVTHKDGQIHVEEARFLYERDQVLSVYPVQSMVEL